MQFEYVEVKTKQDVFLGGFYANHVFKNQEETLSDKVIEFLLNQ